MEKFLILNKTLLFVQDNLKFIIGIKWFEIAIVVSFSHLKMLINQVTKDVHCLTFKDLYSLDKMNFEPALRLCHPRVIESLEKFIPDSDGTQTYLRIMHMVIYAVLDGNLLVEKRIYYIRYSVFLLRMWRYYLLNHEVCSSEDNFITINNYICVEINAHGLYNMALKHIKKILLIIFIHICTALSPVRVFTGCFDL